MRVLFLFFVVFVWSAAPAVPGQSSTGSGLATIQNELHAGNYSNALTLAQSELVKHPGDARLLALEGIALSRLGRDTEALTAYNNALKSAPDFLAALEGAAGLEYKAESSRAVPLLERILIQRPDDETSHSMLAMYAFRKRDCAKAVTHFRQAGAALASQNLAMQAYGSCLMQLNRAREAVPIFQGLLSNQPDDQRARYNLAVVQFTAKDYSETIKTVQPLLVGVSADSDVLDLASAAYEETGDTPRAVALLRQAILANPHNAKYYVEFAALSSKHDSYQVGIDLINAGITQIPKDSSLYVARGILLVQNGHYPEGRADFETANRLDPGQASAAVAEGLASIQQANLDQALATVQTQLKTHPDEAFLHYLQAEILEQKGADVGSTDFKEALRSAGEAVRLQPDFLLARDLLGNMYLRSGQTEKAIEQCRIVLRSSPKDQAALYHLLLALRKKGDPKGEVAGIVKRLAALRDESQNEETSATRYRLYEPDKPAAGPPTN